jgi:putative tRNA adenosine deaminase-associated protein
MRYFAAVLARRSDDEWHGVEVSVDGAESVEDFADIARDVDGDVRLLVLEQDDEYAVIVRADNGEDARAFLTDGHAADEYGLAAVFADELEEIGLEESEDEEGEEDLLEDTPPVHDSAPFGDAEIADDLGTAASDLLALCAHEGTLPIDLLASICEKAGCGDVLDSLRS